MLQSLLRVSGFIFAATGTDYTGRFACVLHGPGPARECCASQDFLAGARTSMKYRVRAACCAAAVFALQTNNWSTFGEMVADLGGGKRGLGKCGSACDALHHFALSAHIYATSFCPPKCFQVLVYSTLLAETVAPACLFAGCVLWLCGALWLNIFGWVCWDDLCINTGMKSNERVFTLLKRRASNIHRVSSTFVRHGLKRRRKCTSCS